MEKIIFIAILEMNKQGHYQKSKYPAQQHKHAQDEKRKASPLPTKNSTLSMESVAHLTLYGGNSALWCMVGIL